jgi:hypothetical protein
VNKEYIDSEMPERSRVFHDCKVCGRKARVVKLAATKPKMLINTLKLSSSKYDILIDSNDLVSINNKWESVQ